MSFGESTPKRPWTLNQEETDAMIKRALDLGINFFDTANTYGEGSSETFIGNSFKKLVKKREDINIKAEEICNILNRKPDYLINEIYNVSCFTLQRYGVFWVYTIAQIRYSAYHVCGISHFFCDFFCFLLAYS